MTAITKARGCSIGAMSLRTGVKIETIRYYERIALMPDPHRTQGGNRQYDDGHLKRLTFIRRSRQLGFGIHEIRTMLAMVDGEDFTCGEIHAMTLGHLSNVERKIADLQRLKQVLAGMAARCSAGDTPDCPILDSLFEAAAS